MSQDSKQSFYTEVDNKKLIADPNAAETLAYTEAEKGRNAALTQEQKLKTEYETGLTELQQKNVETIKSIVDKYPDALQEHVSKGGDTFYGFNIHPETNQKVYEELSLEGTRANVLFSKFGVAISDARYEAFEFVNQATKAEDLQSVHESLRTNPNSGDNQKFLNCKDDITELSGDWKKLLSTNLKAFDVANKGFVSTPEAVVTQVASFVDSL